MIVGITHTPDGAPIELERKVAGKVAIGAKTKDGIPKSLGYWEIRKLKTSVTKVGNIEKITPKWEVDNRLQARLVQLNRVDKPTILPCRLLHSNPEEVFSAFLGKFTDNGLMCRSNGVGTVAEEKVKVSDFYSYEPRKFEDGTTLCKYKDCKDFKNKLCKPHGSLMVFLNLGEEFDDFLHPFKFDTTSQTTILEISHTLNRLYELTKYSHMISQHNTGSETPFMGLFGIRVNLTVNLRKVGERNVHVVTMSLNSEESARLMLGIGKSFTNTVAVKSGTGEIEMNQMQAAAYGLIGNVSEIPKAIEFEEMSDEEIDYVKENLREPQEEPVDTEKIEETLKGIAESKGDVEEPFNPMEEL